MYGIPKVSITSVAATIADIVVIIQYLVLSFSFSYYGEDYKKKMDKNFNAKKHLYVCSPF